MSANEYSKRGHQTDSGVANNLYPAAAISAAMLERFSDDNDHGQAEETPCGNIGLAGVPSVLPDHS